MKPKEIINNFLKKIQKTSPLLKLTIIFITYMFFEGYLKISFDSHLIILGLKYLFAVIFFVVLLANIKKLKINIETGIIILYALITAVQIFNPLLFSLKGLFVSLAGLAWQIGFITFAPLFPIIFKDKKDIEIIFKLIIGLSTISAIVSYFQLFFRTETYNLMYFFKDKIPSTGYMGRSPLGFGITPPVVWYFISTIFCLHFLFKKEQKNKAAYFLLLSNILTALFITGLRMVVLLTAISSFIFILINHKRIFNKKPTKYAIIGVIVLIIAIGTISPSITEINKAKYAELLNPFETYKAQRGWTWKIALEIIEQYPLGTGLRGGGRINTEDFGIKSIDIYTRDNYILPKLAETGIPGLTIYALLCAYLLIKGFRIILTEKSEYIKLLTTTALSILIAFMIGLGFNGGPQAFISWILIGLLFNIESKNKFDIKKMFKTFNKNLTTLLPLVIISGFLLFILFTLAINSLIWAIIIAVIFLISLTNPKIMLLILPIIIAINLGIGYQRELNYPIMLIMAAVICLAWTFKKLTSKKWEIKNRKLFYIIFLIFIISAITLIFTGPTINLGNISEVVFSGFKSEYFGLRQLTEIVSTLLLIIMVPEIFKKEDTKKIITATIIAISLICIFTFIPLSNLNKLPSHIERIEDNNSGIKGDNSGIEDNNLEIKGDNSKIVKNIPRYTGFDNNPNRLASILGLFIPLLLAPLLFGKSRKKYLFIIPILALSIGVLLTISKSTISAMALTIMAMFIIKIFSMIKNKKRNNITTTLIILTILITLITISMFIPWNHIIKRYQTAGEENIDNWKPGTRNHMYSHVLKNPTISKIIFGEGLGSYRKYFENGLKICDTNPNYCKVFYKEQGFMRLRIAHLHNLFLDILNNSGIMVLILFISLITITLSKIYRGVKTKPSPIKPILIGIFFTTIALLINSIYDVPTFAMEINIIFNYLLGIGLMLAE